MNGHTYIYVISILAYLYYLSRIIDRNKYIQIKRSRIHEPSNDNVHEKEQWVHDMRQIKREIKQFRKRSLLWFFIIPISEVALHLLIGEYFVNDQLLSLLFFTIFFLSLLIILFSFKAKERKASKQYTKSQTIQLD